MKIPTSLLKTFNSSLSELGAEMSLLTLKEDGFGPFQSHAHRGFTPREIQAIVRTLSHPEIGFDGPSANGGEDLKPVHIRMTAPAHRSLLGIPLRYEHRVCGALVIGRKDIASFPEKERRRLEGTAGELQVALAKAGIMSTMPGPPVSTPAPAVTPRESGRHRQGRETAVVGTAPSPLGRPEEPVLESLMAEMRALVPYDRALLTWVEPDGKTLSAFLNHTPGHCEWRQGQTLTLDGSAAGWVIRHKKLRLDRDLASTQGRFLDYKQLYKDKFKTALVLPLRKGPEIIGTIVLGSRTPDLYHGDMARAATSVLERLVDCLLAMGPGAPGSVSTEPLGAPAGRMLQPVAVPVSPHDHLEGQEHLLRQERQAAIRELTVFLEQEIQRPLTKTRLELEDTMGDLASQEPPTVGSLEQVENACRELTRIETILNEILDHAKPLELRPRVVRIPEIIESAVAVITGELEQRHISVTRQIPDALPAVKADEGKLQQVFLSILKNALEAMSMDGHIHLEAVPHKGARGRHEVSISIQNDGAPIPTEYIGKIFEPGFTTKAAGTGLGLSSVKKIIEEHRGQISIASGPGQGTTVIIRLPAHAPPRPGGRGRHRPRRR